MNETNSDSDDKENTPTLVASDPRGYHVFYDATKPRLLSETVIESVAAIRGVNPTDAHIPLAESIDPEALDSLFTDTHRGARRADGHIVFTIESLTVFAHSNGHVFILDSDELEDD